MWYIFPQIHDLGYSSTSQYYSIKSLQEAKDYLKDPVLGSHLTEISKALLGLKTGDPYDVTKRGQIPSIWMNREKIHSGGR